MSNRQKRREGRAGIKARQAEARELQRIAAEVAAEEQRVANEAAKVERKKPTAAPQIRKTATTTRRKLSSDAKNEDSVLQKPENGNRNRTNGQHGIVVPLKEVIKGPSTRTSVNREPHDKTYTVITRHLFNLNGKKIFKVKFFIPEDAEINRVSETDVPAHFSIHVGDAYIYISKDFGDIKPGMTIEGQTELKVKSVERPNIGSKIARYPYGNIWKALEPGEEPEYILELDSEQRNVKEGSIHFTPSTGKNRTILHMEKINRIVTK